MLRDLVLADGVFFCKRFLDVFRGAHVTAEERYNSACLINSLSLA